MVNSYSWGSRFESQLEHRLHCGFSQFLLVLKAKNLDQATTTTLQFFISQQSYYSILYKTNTQNNPQPILEYLQDNQFKQETSAVREKERSPPINFLFLFV
jgi:hypothetical protein